MFEIYALLIFVILGALIAVNSRSLLSAIVSLGIVGFGCSLLFLILQAPDVAIVQIVIEVIGLVILIRATGARRDISEAASSIANLIATVIMLVFIPILAYFMVIALKGLPNFGEPLMRVSNDYLAHGLRQTGAADLVTAIILDYRAYDTLGEVAILFTAIAGALTVLRPRGKR